jgi:hypothetical protein
VQQRSETQTPRLPDRAWELSAPESYVLRQGMLALPAMTARFAVFELVAREALRLGSARVRQGLRGRELWLVADGVVIDDVDDPSLRAALSSYSRVRGRRPRSAELDGELVDGVALDDLIKAGARDFGAVEDGAIAVGLRKAGLLSRETRTAVGDRAYGLLDEWLRVGRRRFAEFSGDAAWAKAFLRGAGSAALLLDEPAALSAFADSKIADRLGRAFEDLDLNATGARPLGYHGRSGGGSGLGPAWTGLDSGGYGDGGDGGGGGGGD